MGTSSLIVGAAGLILIAILILVCSDAVLSKRADAADASVTAAGGYAVYVSGTYGPQAAASNA